MRRARSCGYNPAPTVEPVSQIVLQLSTPAQLWTPTGDVLVTNAPFNELLGLPPSTRWQPEGRRLVDDPQFSAPNVRELFTKALTGVPVDIAALPYTPLKAGADGPPDSLRLFLRLRPLWTGDGELAFVFCGINDFALVGERLEHDLMRSQKMENVETLASGVAHEFNNLFTGIRGLTELIRDAAEDGSETVEYAELIHKNVTRGAELIERLSSFARELPHALRRQSLSTYLAHSLHLLQLQVPKRMQLRVDVQADAKVLLDASRMDQALANLLANARDATGGIGEARLTLSRGRPSVAGAMATEDGWAVLELADSGGGIPMPLRERVLEPFFSTKERGRSTGLGLAITQRIISMHDGVLELGDSAELGGAAIRIYLPVAQDDA